MRDFLPVLVFGGNKKTPSEEEACAHLTLALIFQKSVLTELAPNTNCAIANWSGCRGFTGPFPPPLWMSRYSVFCSFPASRHSANRKVGPIIPQRRGLVKHFLQIYLQKITQSDFCLLPAKYTSPWNVVRVSFSLRVTQLPKMLF